MKQYHTIRTVPKSIYKIVETDINTPIHDCYISPGLVPALE